MKKEKIKEEISNSKKYTYITLSYLILGIVIFAMVFYFNIIISTKGTTDLLGNIIDPQT